MEFTEFIQELREKPTYIVLGVQGSGTNLTLRILRQIFGISIVKDRSLILGTAASLIDHPSQENINRCRKKVYNCFFPDPIKKRLLPRQWYHQAANYEGIEKYLDKVEINSPAEFAEFFYSYHAFADGCVNKGIKSDDCWQYLDQLSTVIPNRKYVFLTRDPRDNANSIMYKDFGPRNVYSASRFVKHQLDAYVRETEINATDTLRTKYETVTAHPRDFVNKFSKFSGLEVPSDVEDRLEKLNINKANSDKWKKWSDQEIAMSEAVLWDHLKMLNYEPQTQDPTQLTNTAAARQISVDLVSRIPQRLKSIWDHKIIAR